MKKSTPKLKLQRETLKALIGLELRRVVGGDPAPLVADTGTEVCTTLVIKK
jgi:hypothetical protein